MWKFLNTGYSSGPFNMLYDEQLARELSSSEYEGMLRVYGWDPPCISLGYHQSLDTVNLENCRRGGVDVVWRPTGGRAVLHWEELTYSVVLRADERSLSEVYRHIGLALERGLRELNSEISLARPEPPGMPITRPTSALPCYTSIARFELQYRGKKLIGSAQRRYKFPQEGQQSDKRQAEEVVLQHGSILLGPAHRRLVEFLVIEKKDQIESLEKELQGKSIELSSILRRHVEFSEVAGCLKRGFEAEWGIRFHDVIERIDQPSYESSNKT